MSSAQNSAPPAAKADVAPLIVYRRAAAVVAREAGLKVRDVLRPRGRPARHARHQAIYLASVAGNVRQRTLARIAGCTLSTLQNGLARVEDLRDNAGTDAALSKMEGQFHAKFA